MLRIEGIDGSRNLFITECGRVFKEATYSLRGNRQFKYKCVFYGGKRTDVHRLVAMTFLQNPYNHPNVLHYDDDPSNNNVSNLRWGTAYENSQDAKRNKRFGGKKSGGEKQISAVYEMM